MLASKLTAIIFAFLTLASPGTQTSPGAQDSVGETAVLASPGTQITPGAQDSVGETAVLASPGTPIAPGARDSVGETAVLASPGTQIVPGAQDSVGETAVLASPGAQIVPGAQDTEGTTSPGTQSRICPQTSAPQAAKPGPRFDVQAAKPGPRFDVQAAKPGPRFAPQAPKPGPRFDVCEWDFGRIEEADGAVSHCFVLMNDSPSPLTISRAIPSCSCIMASFPKEEIGPGQMCEVEVFYSPSGASGVTYRNIEIIASGGRSLGTLSVKADVVPADRSIQERYLYTLANLLYVSRKDVPFGYLGHGKTLSKLIYLANASARTMELEAEWSSPYFSVTCPAAVGAGKEVPVLLTWTMPAAPQHFATCRDTVRFTIDGRRATTSVAVSAICTDVAPDRPDAPKLRTYPSQVRLRKGVLSRAWSGSVTLENDGASDLEILAVEAPEGVVTDLPAGTRLPAGARLTVTAKTTGRQAPAATGFRVNLFTNDPVRPYKELIFTINDIL